MLDLLLLMSLKHDGTHRHLHRLLGALCVEVGGRDGGGAGGAERSVLVVRVLLEGARPASDSPNLRSTQVSEAKRSRGEL